ncbi:MAG: N-acetylmuramoyl-L-alanine amidase [Marinilabiliaceae bacterium]|nr:N-acetylmuramoyl-L-alanine amidase [Marinilabiliaceae bacterium]
MVKKIIIFAIYFFSLFWLENGIMFSQKVNGFKTIVIDPGHGGKDPGAVGKLLKEKDIVLDISLKVGEYLTKEMPDLKIIFTRNEDIFVPLDDRSEIANKAKADLFVSIHANSVKDNKVHGTETFVLGLHKSQENLEVAKKENSVIVLEDDYNTKYEGFDPNSIESYIIFELIQNVYLDQSIEVASLVQDQFVKRVGRFDRGVKQAGFLVLRRAAMPCILLEIGFLSNRDEEIFMQSDEGKTYIASAIFRAIRDYINKFEDRSNLAKFATEKNPSENNEKIEFRIQIASSQTKIKDKTGPYKLFSDVWVFEEKSTFKYTTGLANDYETISKLLPKIKEKVPDCFIVAFKNGERVPVSSVNK